MENVEGQMDDASHSVGFPSLPPVLLLFHSTSCVGWVTQQENILKHAGDKGSHPSTASILIPRRRGLILHTYLWGGGFQRYRKSYRIGHKPFHSQVNDKEW